MTILNLPKLGLKAAGGVLLATSATLFAACTGPEATTTPNETENVQVEEVGNNAAELEGETVTIRGDVQEIIDEATFLMDEDQIFGGEDVLVINTGEGLVLPEGEGTEVQITGEVRQLVLADIETEYGLALDPEVYADYENQPAVIAESIALAPDPEEVTEDPAAYYNQVIAVEGEIDDVYSPSAFTLDSEMLFGEEDLLVLSPMGMDAIQDGEVVTVTGTLRPYVKADFERDYNFNWDASVDTVVEAEYEEKPVLVVEGIYPAAE